VSGHERIALRPDDDLKLAKLLKQAGFRADYVHGTGLARVEWYGSIAELVRGLSKNTFAVLEYRVVVACALTLAIVAVDLVPFGLLFAASGPAWWFSLLAVASTTLACGRLAPLVGGGPSDAWALFPSSLLGLFILWRAILRTLWTGGIEWRGTRYSLAELRANRI